MPHAALRGVLSPVPEVDPDTGANQRNEQRRKQPGMPLTESSLRVTPQHRLMRFCQFCGIARDPDRQVRGFAPIQIAHQANCGDLEPLR